MIGQNDEKIDYQFINLNDFCDFVIQSFEIEFYMRLGLRFKNLRFKNLRFCLFSPGKMTELQVIQS